jgi:hypothetical protein
MTGAPGESPKEIALFRSAVPALVVTLMFTVPPVDELGLVNERLVPSGLSAQVETVLSPTVTPVTPTRNEPLKVTDAPPVFGIRDRSAREIDGVWVSAAAHVSVTTSY